MGEGCWNTGGRIASGGSQECVRGVINPWPYGCQQHKVVFGDESGLKDSNMFEKMAGRGVPVVAGEGRNLDEKSN